MEDGHNFGSHGNHKVVKELQITLEQRGKCSSELQAIKNQKIVTAGLSYMQFYKYRLCSTAIHIYLLKKEKHMCNWTCTI